MLLDILFTIIFFGLGSFQGYCMAHRNFRKNLGPAIELAEAFNALPAASKEHLEKLIEQEAADE